MVALQSLPSRGRYTTRIAWHTVWGNVRMYDHVLERAFDEAGEVM